MSNSDFIEYQNATDETARYPDAGEGTIEALSYVVFGLVGEAGEIANKFKKVLRDHGGEITDEMADTLLAEAGDVLWYLARFATELDANLHNIAEDNIEKLLARMRRGTIQGSGDNR